MAKAPDWASLHREAMWCVVCKDLDGAMGPFWDEETAAQVALGLSEVGGCVYVPIPFILIGKALKVDAPDPGQLVEETKPGGKDWRDYGRGYL